MAITRDTQGWPPETTLDAGDASEENASGLWETNERWRTCDKCGFQFPESDTILDEKTGLRLCLTGPKDYLRADRDYLKSLNAGRLFIAEET